MSDVAIAHFLDSLGLAQLDAQRARAVLEAACLTNPRKSRISAAKLGRARAAVDTYFARFCASCAARTEAGGREVVLVASSACIRCAGSRHTRALTELVEACEAARLRRLVIVGGSPDVRRELGVLQGTLELRLIDGLKRRTRVEAQRDLEWADVVVILGTSELAHTVSNLYTRERGTTPVITAARRGVEAIASTLVEHVRRRG